VLLIVTGCSSGHEVDHDAWAADLETWMDVTDHGALERFQNLFIERCDTDEQDFLLRAAMDLDSGREPGWVRTNVQHACPDRLDELDVLIGN
jgi:hypothetical protein